MAVGLFAGIGGIEYGLEQEGLQAEMLCEIMPEAQSVLTHRFPHARLSQDVTLLERLPETEILCAGFPCQDLSIAGKKVGIQGERSSLVFEIFRLLQHNPRPHFVIIENVANIISLNNGEAIKLITQTLSGLGYEWAYRLVDPRSFGIPQRRPRFLFVASDVTHPKYLLYPDDEDVNASIYEKAIETDGMAEAYGFYWTEGKLGIGWGNNSIPPLKCGSTLGLPSSPAVWDVKNDFFGTPSIHDAERLQGFPIDWTSVILEDGFKDNLRWKLIGNAVNTRVSQWLAHRLVNHLENPIRENLTRRHHSKKWPKAAYSDNEQVMAIECSFYPQGINYTPILNFLTEPLKPLSLKATLGFYKRVNDSTLIKYPTVFKESIVKYLKNQYDYDYKSSGTL